MFNALVKRLDFIDVKLIGLVGAIVGIILVKIWDGFLDLHVIWYVVIAVVLYLKPLYSLFLKK